MTSCIRLVFGSTFLSALSLVTFTSEAQAMKVTCGQFKIVKGQVTFKERANSPQFLPAGPNRKICAGGAIQTGSDSRAMIMMPGGDEVHISPSSQLVLQDMVKDEDTSKKKVLIHLIYGKIRANVQKNSYSNEPDSQFRVKTKTAVAGVRGTQFLTGYDRSTEKSEVVTLEGKVEVGQPTSGFDFKNSVFVEAGQKTEAIPNSVPNTPQAIPKQELQKIEQSSSATASTAPSDAKSPTASTTQGNSDKKEGPAEPSKQENPKNANGQAQSPREEGGKADGSKPDGAKPAVTGAVPAANPNTAAEPKAPGSAPTMADSRLPSSVSPRLPSMITNEDLGKSPSAPIIGNVPQMPLVQIPNLIPLPPPTICNFCTERLVNGDAKVDIQVNIQN